jgi:hypothetical protein
MNIKNTFKNEKPFQLKSIFFLKNKESRSKNTPKSKIEIVGIR